MLASVPVTRMLALLAFAATGAAALPAFALATHLQRPPPIILTTKADTQRAAQESYCVTSTTHDGEGFVGSCAVTVDLPPRRLSVVRRGAVVTISFRGATSITDGSAGVRVLGTQRFIRRFTLGGPRTRWRVRLRPGKYEIEVFGRFETADGRSGDTSGSLGLRVRRAQTPPLAGRASAR